ncbi:hypothetical protein BH23ACT10_BH23ACT10_30490 [soil metagenome]
MTAQRRGRGAGNGGRRCGQVHRSLCRPPTRADRSGPFADHGARARRDPPAARHRHRHDQCRPPPRSGDVEQAEGIQRLRDAASRSGGTGPPRGDGTWRHIALRDQGGHGRHRGEHQQHRGCRAWLAQSPQPANQRPACHAPLPVRGAAAGRSESHRAVDRRVAATLEPCRAHPARRGCVRGVRGRRGSRGDHRDDRRELTFGRMPRRDDNAWSLHATHRRTFAPTGPAGTSRWPILAARNR